MRSWPKKIHWPIPSAAQPQPKNPSLSPLRKGGHRGVLKKLTKTCPHGNGEKKFLQSNTISPYFTAIFIYLFVLKQKIYGIASAYLKCLRYYLYGILTFCQ